MDDLSKLTNYSAWLLHNTIETQSYQRDPFYRERVLSFNFMTYVFMLIMCQEMSVSYYE